MTDPDTKRFWVGFDLGGTKMLAVVYDEALRPVGRKRRKTKGQEGIKSGLERIVQTIRDALLDAGVEAGQLGGIGIGCPGPLDLEAGVILDTPNLGWKNVPLKKTLERAFGCPAVIMNDVDAGVYGEYTQGAAQKSRCVVGIFPGTGIGGGCVYEGRILTGGTRSCLEVGHMPIQPDGPLCGCGNRGCLEAVASRLAISSAAAVAAIRGEAPYLLSKAGTDLTNIRSGLLADAVDAGDRAVADLIRQAGDWIGRATGGLVNVLAPDCILLGGGLVEAMPELFQKAVEKGIKRSVMPTFTGTYRVVVATLGDDAAGTGAAAWAQTSFHPTA